MARHPPIRSAATWRCKTQRWAQRVRGGLRACAAQKQLWGAGHRRSDVLSCTLLYQSRPAAPSTPPAHLTPDPPVFISRGHLRCIDVPARHTSSVTTLPPHLRYAQPPPPSPAPSSRRALVVAADHLVSTGPTPHMSSYLSPYAPTGVAAPLSGAAVLADAPVTGFGDWQEWLAEGGDEGMLPSLPATLPSDLFGLTASSAALADDRSGAQQRCVLLSTGELCSSTSPLPEAWLPASPADEDELPEPAAGMVTPLASMDGLPMPSPMDLTRRTPQLPMTLMREDFSPLTTPAKSEASANRALSAAVDASPLSLDLGIVPKTEAALLASPSALVANAFASPLPSSAAPSAAATAAQLRGAAFAAVAAVSSAPPAAAVASTATTTTTPSTSSTASRGTKRRREATPIASEASHPGHPEAASRVGTDLESLSPVAVAKALDDLVAAGVSPALARRALSGNWEGTTSAKARKMTGEQRTVTLFLRRLRNRISAKKSRLQRQAALAGLSDKAVSLYLSAANVHGATKAIAERNVKLRRTVAVLEAQNGALTDLLSVRKTPRMGEDARLPRAIAGA